MQLGNAENGKAIFEGKGGCLNCHRVANRGSHVAPDLSDVGSVHSAATLEDTLLDPDSTAAPGDRTIRAVTKTGAVYTGRHLNEDTWSVQIIDDHERLISLWKPDLAEYKILKSPMPSYKDKLTAFGTSRPGGLPGFPAGPECQEKEARNEIPKTFQPDYFWPPPPCPRRSPTTGCCTRAPSRKTG